MKIKIKNKQGELTTQQLVTIIILITSFIIILFLIFRLNLGETTDKEICRNSVVLAEKSLIKASLDCKTNYLTIESEDKKEIMKTIADEMADCWYMFGEGKINYGVKSGSSIKYAICSIIEFDAKAQEKIPEISYSDFYNYLSTQNKGTSETYLQYLYGIRNVGSFVPQSQVKVALNQDKILTSGKYSIVTGIDDNLADPDEYLKVYIIPTSEIDSRLAQGEFITKA